jgi:hypothetical protein
VRHPLTPAELDVVLRGTAGPEHAGWNRRVRRWGAGELAALGT